MKNERKACCIFERTVGYCRALEEVSLEFEK